MKDQLRKRMFKKRLVRKITFSIANGLSIQLSSYALIRPTLPGICITICSITYSFYKSASAYQFGLRTMFHWLWIIGAITWLDSVTNRPLKVILLYYTTYLFIAITWISVSMTNESKTLKWENFLMHFLWHVATSNFETRWTLLFMTCMDKGYLVNPF